MLAIWTIFDRRLVILYRRGTVQNLDVTKNWRIIYICDILSILTRNLSQSTSLKKAFQGTNIIQSCKKNDISS